MENIGINSGGSGATAEDVISKLKDDGDFDRLRLKIIRKLKENEEMRSNIMSMVKQSAALNRPGAENMKPRQLSDAIHQEIGEKLMSQISDGLWSIIRSPDGMKAEITETVQAVYDRLSNPQETQPSFHEDSQAIDNKLENNGETALVIRTDGTLSDGDPKEPPGFGLTDPNNIGIPTPHNGQPMEGNQRDNLQVEKAAEPVHVDDDAPPGFSSAIKHRESGEASDEDPDVPPGFG